jgi:hypothetical protein
MLAELRWFYDSTTNTMVINLINITSTHIMAKEGIGTVQAQAQVHQLLIYYRLIPIAKLSLSIKYSKLKSDQSDFSFVIRLLRSASICQTKGDCL